MISISAPLTSGDATEIIKQGDITLGDMFKLYRFENWFYQIRMSGKEVRTWLEYAATKLKTDENGAAYVTNSDLTYYDIVYDDGGYVEYLNSNGCDFVENDDSRVIYSTQYDMRQGEDKGQARNLIADYIRTSKTITPEITSTWSVK